MPKQSPMVSWKTSTLGVIGGWNLKLKASKAICHQLVHKLRIIILLLGNWIVSFFFFKYGLRTWFYWRFPSYCHEVMPPVSITVIIHPSWNGKIESILPAHWKCHVYSYHPSGKHLRFQPLLWWVSQLLLSVPSIIIHDGRLSEQIQLWNKKVKSSHWQLTFHWKHW